MKTKNIFEQSLILFDTIVQTFNTKLFKKLLNNFNLNNDIKSKILIEKYLNKAILYGILSLGFKYNYLFNLSIQIDNKNIILLNWESPLTVGTYLFGSNAEKHVDDYYNISSIESNFTVQQQNIEINKKSGFNTQFYNFGGLLPYQQPYSPYLLNSPPGQICITAFRFKNNNFNDIYVYFTSILDLNKYYE